MDADFFCKAYKQPLLYNLAVTREVIKQIYVAEGLQPPTIAAIKAGYQSLWSQASPATLRNLTQSGELLRVGVYGAQAYGIFKVRSASYEFVVSLISLCRLER